MSARWADLRRGRRELLVEKARVLGVHAQELVLPGFYFTAERLFEAQALVFPLLCLLAQLVD